ncbi:hypothetical protein O181_014720 [Austropuccinia psidii MF-1]|uniref:Uncharacterized protein n=1 Tax=Austropuccinia psidii MF-1 TaxID=1389203 RepID=A0A9Q3C2E5_9BASI|nr:hypothetical protein [Austropuccinia psidii MF-1]
MDYLGDWQPPFISTGLEEPLRYSDGLRNTDQTIEKEERLKAKYQQLPSKETIQPKDTIRKGTSIPGGSIQNEYPEKGGIITTN